MSRGAWWATVPGITELDMTERLTVSLWRVGGVWGQVLQAQSTAQSKAGRAGTHSPWMGCRARLFGAPRGCCLSRSCGYSFQTAPGAAPDGTTTAAALLIATSIVVKASPGSLGR